MLLHVCCANCAAYPLELFKDLFDITMLFFNPNIHPLEEYLKRLDDVKRLSGISSIPLIIGTYEPEKWHLSVKGLEDEPEGGKRCQRCFYMRLENTAALTKDNGMDIFATTLSISPHKDTSTINTAALSISGDLGIKYHPANLKKKDGFRKANELSRSYGFYRQDYCGCQYSIR